MHFPSLPLLLLLPLAAPCAASISSRASLLVLLPILHAKAYPTSFPLSVRPSSLPPAPSRWHARRNPPPELSYDARRASAGTPEPASFLELQQMCSRLQKLERTGVDWLRGFYDEATGCFALVPGRPRLSVTSTSFALLAADASAVHWHESPIELPRVLARLMQSGWSEQDVFTCTLVVVTWRVLDPSAALLRRGEASPQCVQRALQQLLLARPRRRTGRTQATSAYMRFWIARAASLLLASAAPPQDAAPYLSPALPAGSLPPNASAAVLLALERSCDVAFDEMCRQLAYYAAGDMLSFDVVVLCYSLLTYVLVGDAHGRTAARAREASTRDAVSAASLPPRNAKLVEAAVAAVFSEMRDGLWPPGQPIFKSRGGGNDVGNAFVFTPDMLASLIEVLPPAVFRRHLGSIAAHLAWLEEHVIEEIQIDGQLLRGWRSNHLPPEGAPLAWCTAQGVRCLSRMRQLTRALLCADVLATLGGEEAAAADARAWDRLLDSDLPATDEDRPLTTLKATLEERMLRPLAALTAADPLGREASGGADERSYSALEAEASYSAILFGPPGTAKTTVVKAIALKLGWGFVAIDTSVFLAHGMANVAGRITQVFEQLLQLEKVVVLFDEVEEFALDRCAATVQAARPTLNAPLPSLVGAGATLRSRWRAACSRLPCSQSWRTYEERAASLSSSPPIG